MRSITSNSSASPVTCARAFNPMRNFDTVIGDSSPPTAASLILRFHRTTSLTKLSRPGRPKGTFHLPRPLLRIPQEPACRLWPAGGNSGTASPRPDTPCFHLVTHPANPYLPRGGGGAAGKPSRQWSIQARRYVRTRRHLKPYACSHAEWVNLKLANVLWNVGRRRACRARRRAGSRISSIHAVSSTYSHHQDAQHIVLDVADHPVVSNPIAPQPSKRAAKSFAPLARIG